MDEELLLDPVALDYLPGSLADAPSSAASGMPSWGQGRTGSSDAEEKRLNMPATAAGRGVPESGRAAANSPWGPRQCLVLRPACCCSC